MKFRIIQTRIIKTGEIVEADSPEQAMNLLKEEELNTIIIEKTVYEVYNESGSHTLKKESTVHCQRKIE